MQVRKENGSVMINYFLPSHQWKGENGDMCQFVPSDGIKSRAASRADLTPPLQKTGQVPFVGARNLRANRRRESPGDCEPATGIAG